MRKNTFWATLAVVLGLTIGLSAVHAGEELTPTKPVEKVAEKKAEDCCGGCDKAKDAKAAKGEECCGGCDKATKVATKTETPMCSIMGFVTAEMKKTKGAEGQCCKGAMKAWFAGGKDVPLAALRDKMVADGWNAETTIAFFEKMAAARAAKADAAKVVPTAATGDAAAPAKGDCSGCDKDCSGCDKAKDCSGCDKECSGCDKAKEKTDAKPAKVGS